MRFRIIRIGALFAGGLIGIAVLGFALLPMTSPWISRVARLVGFNNPARLPVSTATFDDVDRAVGCRSNLPQSEKEEAFRQQYENRWMNWDGEIVYVRAGQVGLRLRSTSDSYQLRISLDDRRASFRRALGDQARLRFVLRGRGDCRTPFEGDSGQFQGNLINGAPPIK
jgi:hypothetical protein